MAPPEPTARVVPIPTERSSVALPTAGAERVIELPTTEATEVPVPRSAGRVRSVTDCPGTMLVETVPLTEATLEPAVSVTAGTDSAGPRLVS